MSEPAVEVAQESVIPWQFWARKLHSLSGIVPIGIFLIEHFWTNSKALGGAANFDRAVEELHQTPYLLFIEIAGIWIPILYHALYGVLIVRQGRNNALTYKYARNWLYTLQRVSGMLLMVYIGWHFWEMRIEPTLGGERITYEFVSREMAEGGMVVFYTLGILASVFHFANGLWAFLVGWGITTTQRAMKRSAVFCWGLGIALALFGLNAMLGFLGHGINIHFGNS